MNDSSPESSMQRFMQDLFSSASATSVSSTPAEQVKPVNQNSAKSVFDFSMATLSISNSTSKSSNNSSSDTSTEGSSDGSFHFNNNNNDDKNTPNNAMETKDTFDIHSLVLVSDNARVFANARPKATHKVMTTSASWHSSSELRKQYTARTRWGGTSETRTVPTSPDSTRNQPFSLNKNNTRNNINIRSSSNNRTISNSSTKLRSITRRTSDSCLSIPTRSWMTPQHKQQQQQQHRQQTQPQSQLQLPPHSQQSRRRISDSCISLPTRSWMKEQPQNNHQQQSQSQSQRKSQSRRTRRTGAPPRPSQALVASRFSASPLETALEARRSLHSRSSPSRGTLWSDCSSDSVYSSGDSTYKSFESCDSKDAGLPEKATETLHSPPQGVSIAARDSRQLISCNKTSEEASGGWNSRWSPPTSTSHPQQQHCAGLKQHPKQRQLPAQGLTPIPPSLLLPYDRFQASVPTKAARSSSSSESLSSVGSRSRNPRLSRSRSSKSSGSKLSTQFKGSSRTNLQNSNFSKSSSSISSRIGLGRKSLFGGRRSNSRMGISSTRSTTRSSSSISNQLLGSSKSYHNHHNTNTGFHSSTNNAHDGARLRSQSDHHSPVSTLVRALGDMAPKRKGRSGRRT